MIMIHSKKTDKQRDKFWIYLALAALVFILPSLAKAGSESSSTVTGTLLKPGYPRNIGNNNPGNIRIGEAWDGRHLPNTDGAFDQFVTMAYGFRAMILNIKAHVKQGKNTVNKLINAWAPASDGNVPAGYVNRIEQNSELEGGTVIDYKNQDLMWELCREMAVVEGGEDFRSYIKKSDFIAGWLMLPNGYA